IESGKDIDYYVAKAGGYNWNAFKSKTRVIKARTGQRFRPSKRVVIEGGDTLHVPEKKPIDFWGVAKDSALLFANVATIIILARQLSN
ncbi:MAG: SLBB domain-containing protein, partial [Candidatus Latescibacterota bacterium]